MLTSPRLGLEVPRALGVLWWSSHPVIFLPLSHLVVIITTRSGKSQWTARGPGREARHELGEGNTRTKATEA